MLTQLRHRREMLLTLLEAFVYDPLVDWTVDKDDDDEGLCTWSEHALLVI